MNWVCLTLPSQGRFSSNKDATQRLPFNLNRFIPYSPFSKVRLSRRTRFRDSGTLDHPRLVVFTKEGRQTSCPHFLPGLLILPSLTFCDPYGTFPQTKVEFSTLPRFLPKIHPVPSYQVNLPTSYYVHSLLTPVIVVTVKRTP